MATPIGYNWQDIWQDVWQEVWTDQPPVVVPPGEIIIRADVTINRVAARDVEINTTIQTEVDIA